MLCWTAPLRRSVGARHCAWSCRSKARWRWAGAGARGIAFCASDLKRRAHCAIGLPRRGRFTRSAHVRSAWNMFRRRAAASYWRSVCAESIDDLNGAAVTRHNLNILLGPPAPPGEPPRQPPSPTSPGPRAPLFSSALLGVIVVALVAIGVAQASHAGLAPTPASPLVTPSQVAPSLTSAPSATAMPTAAATATPTPTASPTPTATSTSTPTSTPTWTPSQVPCIPRYGWPIYIVQYGDTLFSIAHRTGSTPYEFMRANCLMSDYIYTGQSLFVPRLPLWCRQRRHSRRHQLTPLRQHRRLHHRRSACRDTIGRSTLSRMAIRYPRLRAASTRRLTVSDWPTA